MHFFEQISKKASTATIYPYSGVKRSIGKSSGSQKESRDDLTARCLADEDNVVNNKFFPSKTAFFSSKKIIQRADFCWFYYPNPCVRYYTSRS
jgi:hypothetical protein